MRPVGLWTMSGILVVVAGCVGAEAVPNEATQPDVGGAAVFDDTTGALTVLVHDDELNPIPNATVGLATTAANATVAPRVTAIDGQAGFSNLAPGKYNVQVIALGFGSGSAQADVIAGQVSELQVTIVALPSDDPYFETIQKTDVVRSVLWRIGPNCDTIVQPPIGTCLGFQDNDVTFYRVLNQDWATIVDEATWIPNTAASHQRAYVFATFPNVTDFSGVPDFKSPGHFEAAGPNPVTLRIERQEIRDRGFPEESQYGEGPNAGDCGTRCGTRFRAVNDFEDLGVQGVIGVSVMWDQSMTVYNTEFHKEVAPEGFTALPDA